MRVISFAQIVEPRPLTAARAVVRFGSILHVVDQPLSRALPSMLRAFELRLIMQGTLYLIATPIGNLEDITLRALRTLGEVDLIACEDTRHTRKLLAHFNISKPTVSYHTHNERERTAELVSRLEAGANVALVS